MALVLFFVTEPRSVRQFFLRNHLVLEGDGTQFLAVFPLSALASLYLAQDEAQNKETSALKPLGGLVSEFFLLCPVAAAVAGQHISGASAQQKQKHQLVIRILLCKFEFGEASSSSAAANFCSLSESRNDDNDDEPKAETFLVCCELLVCVCDSNATDAPLVTHLLATRLALIVGWSVRWLVGWLARI